MKHVDGRWLRWASATDAGAHRGVAGPSGTPHQSDGAVRADRKVSAADLRLRIDSSALAFRGYDVTNLGRSAELINHAVYGPVVRQVLGQVSEICSAVFRTNTDICEYILAGAPTALENFPRDICTIVGMELAQVELLEKFFDVPVRDVRLTFGYSIGELSALILGGTMSLEHLLPVPLTLAPDCAELAGNTTLGVLFTRGGALHREDVERLCMTISGEGHGLIGPSAYLSPNTALLLGQSKTLDRVEKLMADFIPEKVMLRRNPNRWPPLHSPLVWERSIPNRAAVLLYQIKECANPPKPIVVSNVTGEASYDGLNTRQILVNWTDHPQRLWDVIDETLSVGIDCVIHVGPSPNLIPATFARIENNVVRQLGQGPKYLNMLSRRLAAGLNRHAWLTRLLPSKAALLRLPYIVHVTLEDWLLEQTVEVGSSVALAESPSNGQSELVVPTA